MKPMKIIILLLAFGFNIYAQKTEKGTLTNKEKQALIIELKKFKNIEIDSAKTIVINFYIKPEIAPNGSCIDHYTADRTYQKSFRKSDAVQFFITEKNYSYEREKVYEDQNDFIKNLLFKNAELCGNYVIIKPNGDFFKRLDEYRQEEIIGLIKIKK